MEDRAMPFVSKQETVRLHPPATLPGVEEGDWIEVRGTYTAGMRREVIGKGRDVSREGQLDVWAFRKALLEAVVVGWSDSEPVTPDALEAMPADVQDWIAAEFERRTSARSVEEKKDSNGSSSPTTARERARSRQS
jgi:hypothetical protein